MSEMHCPSCDANDVVKASFAFEREARGASTSALARRLKPPLGPTSVTAVMVAMCVALGALIVAEVSLAQGGRFFLIVAFGIGVALWILIGMRSSEKARYGREFAAYDRIWLCQRCGETFDIDEIER